MAGDWGEYQKFILNELDRLNKNYEKLIDEVVSLQIGLARTKTKVLIFSSIGGGIIGLAFMLIEKLI